MSPDTLSKSRCFQGRCKLSIHAALGRQDRQTKGVPEDWLSPPEVVGDLLCNQAVSNVKGWEHRQRRDEPRLCNESASEHAALFTLNLATPLQVLLIVATTLPAVKQHTSPK